MKIWKNKWVWLTVLAAFFLTLFGNVLDKYVGTFFTSGLAAYMGVAVAILAALAASLVLPLFLRPENDTTIRIIPPEEVWMAFPPSPNFHR